MTSPHPACFAGDPLPGERAKNQTLSHGESVVHEVNRVRAPILLIKQTPHVTPERSASAEGLSGDFSGTTLGKTL